MPLRILLAVLVALVGPTSPAWATGPQFGPMSGGSGGGVTALTCSAGDFFSSVTAGGVFTCSTPSAGSAAFSAITGSTNTTAAMVVGTGASLSTSGSGTIAATTATALAANGGNCAAGSAPLGVDTLGAVESCTTYAPVGATYIVQTADSTLTGEQAMGALGTGLVKNTTTTGVQSIYAGTSCTNQFPRSLDASGAATCASVANADLAGSIAMSKTLLTADAGLVLSTNSLATASSETGFITGSTSLPGTCGEGAVYQDTDSGGTETYTCTAANTWTKYVAATDNVATSTALAADPSDCAANRYATTIAASGNLTCAQVDLANGVTGTLPNANTTATSANTNSAIVARDGSGNFSAGTITASLTGAASLNTLLAGRAGTGNDTTISTDGAGTIYGSGTTANDLTLRANDDDTTTGEINLNAPRLDIYPSYPASTAADFTLIRSAPTTTLTGGTADYIMVEAAPAITVADTTSSQYFRAAGSVDRTGTSGGTLYQITGFHNAPTLTSSTTGGPLFQDAFFDATVVNQVSGTATQNTYQPISFLSKPTFKAASGATLTIGQTTGVDINPSWGVAAGGTLTNTTFSAFKLHTPNEIGGTLSLPTYIALDVEDLDTAGVTTPLSLRSVGTTTEMRHAGPARFGATGAVTSGKVLDAQGDTYIGGYLDIGDDLADLTTNTVNVIDIAPNIAITGGGGVLRGVSIAPTLAQSETNTFTALQVEPTIAQSGSTKFPFFYALNAVGTITTSGTTSSQTAALMRHATTYTTATNNVQPVGVLAALVNNPTVNSTATGGAATVTSVKGLFHQPLISRSGAGSMTVTDDIAVDVAGTYTESAGTLAVTNRTGLKFSDVTNTSSATAITNNIGVDIAALSTATTNIGIRNADTTVNTPATSTISGVSSTISAGQTVTELNNTSGGAVTITAAPTIADGVNGQILYVFNGSANNVVIQDQGTLASSNLRLSATTITLGTRDSITLMYSSTVGDWIQIGQVNVL